MDSGSGISGLLARSRNVLHGHAVALDIAVATVMTVGALLAVTSLRQDKTVALTVLGAVACTSSVGWRRLAPTAAALTAFTAVACYQVSGHDTQGVFIALSLLLTSYTVGRSVPSRWRVGLVAVCALASVTVIQINAGFSLSKDTLSWVPLALAPIAAGGFVARRVALASQLAMTSARLQGERDLARSRAVTQERTRVARELHDVVAHSVSVMVIQASAARLSLGTDPDAARTAMSVVVASGREALADLRRVVDDRTHMDDVVTEPTLGIGQLPALVERARDAGNEVRLHIDAHVTLSPDVDLTVYRIVQEALTNVRKHAPSASVEVSVTSTTDGVAISVADGGAAQRSGVGGSGNGLIGMRERVAVYGGELHVGANADGGFSVRARIPLTVHASVPEPRRPVTSAPQGSWLTKVPLDALISLAWLIPLEIEALTSTHRSGPVALNVAAVAGMALAGVIRRRRPLLFLLVVGALTFALSGGIAAPRRVSVVNTYTLFVGGYTVAAYCRARWALAGLGFLLGGVVVTTVTRHSVAGIALGGALTTTLVWSVGRLTRNQRILVADLRSATTRLAAETDERAYVARQQERVRIARDLHAIVARMVTTMVTQAEALREPLDADLIAAIEETGRQALVQLRQILGVLRNRSDPAPREPQRSADPVMAGVPT